MTGVSLLFFNDKKCTIIWHVDNLNMSHIYPDIVSSVIDDIDAECGKIAKMTITRGKIHKYLRIPIDYYSPGKLILSMVDYIIKILNYTPEYTKGQSETPEIHHILYGKRYKQTIPNLCRTFSSLCDADIVHVKESMSRHTYVSIIIMHYSERYR